MTIHALPRWVRQADETCNERRRLPARDSRFWRVCRLLQDRRAVSALEYGLIVSMVAVVIVFAITSFDVNFARIGEMFTSVASKL